MNIGDSVVLNGKSYTVMGSIARSVLLQDATGKQFKCTASMIAKIQGSSSVPTAPKKDPVADDKRAFDRWIAKGRMWDPTFKVETKEEILDLLKGLVDELSPERLSCDGECSRSEVAKKRAAINAVWRHCERLLGRKVRMVDLGY